MANVSAVFEVTTISAACGVANTATAISYAYSIGSVLYSYPRAVKGYLETLAVRDIHIATSGNFLYLDTFNRLWNEEDLCIESVARAAVIAYWEQEEALLLQKLLDCNN